MKLKFTFLSIFLPLVVTINVCAKTSIGLKAGMNFSQLDGLMFGSITCVNAGIPAEFRFSKKFALQPEINFITKGGKEISRTYDNGFYYDLEDAFKINYLEIPLYTKFSFGSENVKLDLLTGPSVGFAINGMTSSKEMYYGKIKSDSKSIDFEKDSVSRINFSVNFGIGITFLAGSRNMFFNICYQSGLTDILTAKPGYENPTEAYHSDLIICLGIFTPITSKKTVQAK
jgi:hypothetical protein